MKIKHVLPAIAVILFAILLRLLPHPPNVAPITAMAIFGGVYIDKKYALIVPLVALFLSDIFIGFHDTMLFVYGSFLISGLIGLWLKRYKNKLHVIGGTFLASFLFYLITNFGVWLVSSMYSKTLYGLIESYTLALPFYRNTLIGDFLYVGLFFVSYELINRYLSISSNKKAFSISKRK